MRTGRSLAEISFAWKTSNYEQLVSEAMFHARLIASGSVGFFVVIVAACSVFLRLRLRRRRRLSRYDRRTLSRQRKPVHVRAYSHQPADTIRSVLIPTEIRVHNNLPSPNLARTRTLTLLLSSTPM